MIISTSSAIPLRPRRRSNCRRLLAGLLLFALFPLGLSAQDAIRIVTKTEYYSANWLWSEEPPTLIYNEFEGEKVAGKARFPHDLDRKKIGIGEIIHLKLKEKPGSNVAGDKSKATWSIIEGGEWAGFSTKNGEPGPSVGEVVMIGAKVVAPKVPADSAPRTVKVRVTTDTTPALTADVVITVVIPDGGLKSRHCGPLSPDAPPDAFVPPTIQLPLGHVPPNKMGASTKLVVIPTPTDVNFGGKFEAGLGVIERDISSPPVTGTFKPETGSLYANATHTPTKEYVPVDYKIAGFYDTVGEGEKDRQEISEEHKYIWTCEWRWLDAAGAVAYNDSDKTGDPGGVALMPRVKQIFSLNPKIIPRPGKEQIETQTATVSKYNSSATRDTGVLHSIRDISNNWKP